MADETEAQPKPWGDRLLTEGVTLASVPVAGLIATVLFEAGACRFYGVPRELVTTSAWSGVNAVGLILAFTLLFWGNQMVGKVNRWSFWSVARLTVVSFATSYLTLLMLPRWALHYEGAIVAVLLVPTVVCVRFAPALARRWYARVERFGIRAVAVAFAVVVALLVAYPIGYARAERRTYYPVLLPDETTGELVVLRIYGENLICSPLDATGHTFGPDLVLVNLTAVPRVRMIYRQTGPLWPATGGPAGRPSTGPSTRPTTVTAG